MRPGFRWLILLTCHACLLTAVTTDNVCPRPPEEEGSELSGGQLFFEPGEEVTLSCKQGYSSQGGSRKIICKKDGEWTERGLKCSLKRCPVPELPQDGKADFNQIVYRGVITYSCNDGYVLVGANSSECLHTGQWSEPTPQCKPVTCGPPPLPPYTKIVYDRPITGDIVQFGFGGTYECLPPMVLFGNRRGTCTADGSWSKAPECKLVMCPVPRVIENGFLSFTELREYGYGEKVKYGCHPTYHLEGPAQVDCKETGKWATLPVCRAPCTVDIQRGRILYKGSKKWIENFTPNQVLHLEEVAVYCLNKQENCGYPVSMQCNDGHMTTPSCYEEPDAATYKMKADSLPSEIKQC
ncbi:beta-2-glycoprotein 1-like [Clarias gariepinus]